TTSMAGSFRRTYLATVAPPHPPPTTTTRGPRLGMMSPFAVVAQPPSHETEDPTSSPSPTPDVPRNFLRVDRIVTSPSFRVDRIVTPPSFNERDSPGSGRTGGEESAIRRRSPASRERRRIPLHRPGGWEAEVAAQRS